MSINAINLAARLILEITGLLALGIWGWDKGDGLLKVVVALVVPITAAAIWGMFAVPGDPSRSGNAPVVISGVLRLIIECVFFSSVVWVLLAMHYPVFAWLFAAIVIVHYVVSFDRVTWLIRQ